MIGSCTVVVLLSLHLNAQSDTSGTVLGEIIVSATRQPLQLQQLPYSVSARGSQTLHRLLPRSVPEVIPGMTGIFLQKTNHGGGSAFIRGLTGNQVLYMIDGIRMNNATYRFGPNQYLNTADPFTLQGLEAVRGSGSVQYGSDALGGVVYLRSTQPNFVKSAGGGDRVRGHFTGQALTKWMSGGMEQTATGQLGYQNEKMALAARISYSDFGDLVGGNTTGMQTPSGYKQFSYDFRAGFRLNNRTELRLVHQQLKQEHVPVYHKLQLENFSMNEMDPQKRMLSYARLIHEGKNQLLETVTFTAFHQRTEEGRNSQKRGSLFQTREEDMVSTLGATLEIQSRMSEYLSAVTGIDIYHDQIGSKKEIRQVQTGASTEARGLYPDQATYGNYSAYSLLRWNQSAWAVHGGLRYNFFSINMYDTSTGYITIQPSALVYQAAALYRLSDAHQIWISAGTGYRAPNIDDMGSLGIVDFRYEIPAYDLEPERSKQLELGYRFRGKNVRASVSTYYMKLQGLIARVRSGSDSINGYPVYRKENVGESRVMGLETEAGWQLASALELTANLTYTIGDNLTREEPMRRIPPLFGRLACQYAKKRYYGLFELMFAGTQNRLAEGDKADNRIPPEGTPGWWVLNLFAGYEASRWAFRAGLQNLLNQDYRTHGSGINGVGRSIWLSAIFQM